MQTSPRIAVSGAVIVAALSLFTPSTLAQPPHDARTEAGGASPSLAARLELSSRRLPALAVAQRSSRSQMTASRTAWMMGASSRLMRPHDVAGRRRGPHAIAPWLGGDLLYVRTGGLDLAGFAAVAGLAPIDQRRRSWIGPFVRYYQIEHAGFDNRDAKILTVGIGLEIGTGIDRRRERMLAVALASAALPAPFDRDGVAGDAGGSPDRAWHP